MQFSTSIISAILLASSAMAAPSPAQAARPKPTPVPEKPLLRIWGQPNFQGDVFIEEGRLNQCIVLPKELQNFASSAKAAQKFNTCRLYKTEDCSGEFESFTNQQGPPTNGPGAPSFAKFDKQTKSFECVFAQD